MRAPANYAGEGAGAMALRTFAERKVRRRAGAKPRSYIVGEADTYLFLNRVLIRVRLDLIGSKIIAVFQQ